MPRGRRAALDPRAAELLASAGDVQGAREVAPELAAGARAAGLESDPRSDPTLAAGCLEVHVRIGERPFEGRVTVRRIVGNDLGVPLGGASPYEARLERGAARFDGLPQGVLLVGVHAGPGPPLRISWVNSDVRGARLDVSLGGARLRGRVLDADGAVPSGAWVGVVGRQGLVRADVGPDGTYDTGAILPPGRHTVRVQGHPIGDRIPGVRLDVDLDDLEELSFGLGGDLVRWTGRLLDPEGAPVTASDGVPESLLQLVGRDGRGAVRAVAVVDGRIDQWLEPGSHALRQATGGHTDPRAGLDLGRVDLTYDLQQDVQLAGFVVTGRFAGPAGEASRVTLGRQGDARGLTVPLGLDGSFRIVGLAPGTYALRGPGRETRSFVLEPHGPRTLRVGDPP